MGYQEYAVFNQPEGAEDDPQGPYPDFSGGKPVDPDSENATPSPVDPGAQQDTPVAAPVDDAAAYANSPENQDSMLSVQPPDYSFPMSGGVEEDTGAAQYAVQGHPVPGMNDPNGPVPQPAYDPYLTYANHSIDLQALKNQYAREAKENTKPSIWRRIGGSLAGGAVAFGSHNPAEGMKVVNEVLNTPAQNAAARNARAERPLVQQLTNDQAQDAATQRANQGINANNAVKERNYRTQVIGNLDAARAQNFAAQAAAKNEGINGDGWKQDDPNNPLGSYSGTTIGGKPIHSATPPKSVQLDPVYKIA
jgi:hypothetical protein